MSSESGQHARERRAKPYKPYRPPQGGGQGGGGAALALLAQLQAAIPGLPGNVAAIVGQILSQDPSEAGQGRAFAYIRGTDWFKSSYAGFDQGAANGLWGGNLGDLVGYRQWRVGIRDQFKQNYGRDANFNELISFANSGFDAGTVGQIAQGHAYETANAGEWQYFAGGFDSGQLTDAEKQAYGQQLAGRSSDLGLNVQKRIQAAMAKVQVLFQGTLAGQGGQLPTPGLQKLPDIGA